MKIALIGLPQAGKKTMFSLLTGRDLARIGKPGDVPEGRAPIRDQRVDRLAEIYRPQRKVYAENVFTLCPDIPAAGSSRQWIEAARRCDLLCLVVRDFASDLVYHQAGSVDAGRDLNNIESELILADMERIETRLERLHKEQRPGKSAAQELEGKTLARCLEALEQGQWLQSVTLEPHAKAAIRSLELVTFLPRLVAFNVDEDRIGEPGGEGELRISASIEREIMEIEERQEYLEDLGLQESGIDRMNRAAYERLGLMSFYTVGPDEVRAWTIRQGATAPVAGGKIHSDIERGFIRVEVVKYDDLIRSGSEAEAKARGLAQLKGADYVVEDGDVCHFLFNV